MNIRRISGSLYWTNIWFAFEKYLILWAIQFEILFDQKMLAWNLSAMQLQLKSNTTPVWKLYTILYSITIRGEIKEFQFSHFQADNYIQNAFFLIETSSYSLHLNCSENKKSKYKIMLIKFNFIVADLNQHWNAIVTVIDMKRHLCERLTM